MHNYYDLALLSGSTLLSFSTTILFKSQLQGLNDKLQQYANAGIFSPSELLNHVTSNNDKNTNGEVRLRVFLQGILSSDYPFIGKVSKLPMIISQYYIDDIYSNEKFYGIKPERQFFKPQKRTRFYQKNAAPVFDITDFNKNSPNPTCKVNRNLGVNAADTLELVGHREHLRALTPIDRLMVLIGLIFKFILKIKLSKKGFRGFKIGVQEIEYGVKLNQILLVFGEVIVDLKQGTLRMDKPLHILKHKDALLKHIQSKIRSKALHLLISSLLFSVSMYFFLKRLRKEYYTYLQRKQQERLDKLRGVNQLVVSGIECIICCERIRNIIFKPCKHLSICRECYLKLPLQVCPICKTAIKDHIEIFIS